jgi:hypothetical protein
MPASPRETAFVIAFFASMMSLYVSELHAILGVTLPWDFGRSHSGLWQVQGHLSADGCRAYRFGHSFANANSRRKAGEVDGFCGSSDAQ